MQAEALPLDWYRSSFSEAFNVMSWDEDGGEKVDLLAGMLRLGGEERVLDLACATGGVVNELSRRGHVAIGVEPRADLLEIAGCEAARMDIWPYFINEDPRHADFHREFDLVLSVNGGAFGYYEEEGENMRAFEVAARALRRDGRLLAQVPNLPYVEARLSPRTWFTTGETLELIEHCWNAGARRIEGAAVSVESAQDLAYTAPEPFQRRIYSLEELAAIFERVGLRLVDVYDEHGERCAPGAEQSQLYVEARA